MRSTLEHPSPSVAGGADQAGGSASLTGDQVARLVALLQDQVAELHRRLDHHDEVLRSFDNDASVEGADWQKARLAAERDLEAVRATNRALASIDDGTYGRCTGCDRPVPFERLEALPATETCVVCPDDR